MNPVTLRTFPCTHSYTITRIESKDNDENIKTEANVKMNTNAKIDELNATNNIYLRNTRSIYLYLYKSINLYTILW